MKAYIKENFNLIIAITALLFVTIALVGSNEILAQTLPSISKYHIIYCNLDKEEYAYGYTGKEVVPTVTRVVLADEEGNTTVLYKEQIAKVECTNNIEIGMADAKISFAGYNGSLICKNVFSIVPDVVQNFGVKNATKEAIDLEWETLLKADGYLVYKSVDNGQNFNVVATIEGAENTTFQDVDMQFNALFQYYVCAYKKVNEQQYIGLKSQSIEQATPLTTPVITSAKSIAHDKIVLKWNIVEGAVGYEVFRSTSKKGEYQSIAQLKDGTIAAYTDAKCECASEYYYYIKACQMIGEQEIYGEASEIVKEQAKPAATKLSGGTSGGTAVTLNWNVSEGATGYEVYRRVGYAGTYELVLKTEKADVLSWSDAGLDKGTAYFYRIRPYSVVNGKTAYGNYSSTYQKPAIIEYNYAPGSEANVLKQYAGTPYVFGGETPSGWDCSGFVKWTFRNHFGIGMPRTAVEQSRGGTAVSLGDRSSWKAGDLLFYRDKYGKIGHVAIYLGSGKMIHALSKKRGTLIQSVDEYEGWDANTLVSVRRYLP